MSYLPKGFLVAVGSPLLDITANVDLEFLNKYNLKPDDAIRAEDKHKTLIDDLMKYHQPVTFTSGGSAGNTVRVFQWLLENPDVSAFTGCIGNDKFGNILEDKAGEVGVDVRFQRHPTKATGTCAVLVTDTNRSLVADLAASSHFFLNEFLYNHQELIDKAKVVYVEGFFLTVSLETVLFLGKQSSLKGDIFCLNLSAPFLCNQHAEKVLALLPYTDILFGNQAEASELFRSLKSSPDLDPEETMNMEEEDYSAMSLWLCAHRKSNPDRKRIVILTQGSGPVLLATHNIVTEYPVEKLEPEEVVDTNGAGDAFAGGFLSELVQGHPLAECVRCGIYAASEVIRKAGCVLPERHSFQSCPNIINDK